MEGRPPYLSRSRRASRGALFALLIGIGVLLTACLGPNDVDRSGHAPLGRLESVSASADGIRIRGWAADPDTPGSISIAAGTSSEKKIMQFAAAIPRPDLARVRRVRGIAHGFDVTLPWVSAGRRQVCVGIFNVGRGRVNRGLGCPTVDVPSRAPPAALGFVQSVAADSPTSFAVTGWAFDPYRQVPTDVVVRVDGKFVARRPADQVRADIGIFFRRDPRTGFSLSFPSAAGPHTVCLTVLGSGAVVDADLACQTVVVPGLPDDRRPTGNLVVVRPVTGGVEFSGTVSDPDGAPSAVSVAVRTAAGTTTQEVPVSASQFTATIGGLASGPVRLCVTLLDVPSAPGVVGTTGNRPLSCASAVVGGATSIGTTGAPTALLPVRPADSSPVTGIDRDAGVSTALHDGAVFWIFGDSAAFDGRGDLKYFIHNTAAVAVPGALTTTPDASVNGRPFQFATPVGGFPACPAARPEPTMWPLSAVSTYDGSTDRVVVFMSEMCLGQGAFNFEYRGISVVEWRRPADPSLPIIGTVLAHQLFNQSDRGWGSAAWLTNDGMVHAYACTEVNPAATPAAGSRRCGVARVPLASVANRAAWTYWTGGTNWSADAAAAVEMSLPDGLDGGDVPRAGFTVNYDPIHHLYVMAYTPWPGLGGRIQVRVATLPTGPWTAPVDVDVPGCDRPVAGVQFTCYAGTSQPSFSEDGLLGLGFYNQLLTPAASGGQYLVVKVPFTVVTPTP